MSGAETTTSEQAELPPYRRFSYDADRDNRSVSPDPKPLPSIGPQIFDKEDTPEQRTSSRRRQLADKDFDHHAGHSSAATIFYATDVDSSHEQSHFRGLKSWNDGRRDSDRQIVEGHADKILWTKSYGHKLELPHTVVSEAQTLLRDLGDIRRLGYYNNLHLAVLAALVEAYRRWCLRLDYRVTRENVFKSWRDREDFRELYADCGFSESDLSDAVTHLDKKTDV